MAGGLRLTFKASAFLKPAKVIDPMRKATERNLFKAGGFLRTIARRSLKRGAKPSIPGTPPKFRKSKTVFFLMIFEAKGVKRVEIAPEEAQELEKAGFDVVKEKIILKRGGALRKSISFLVNKPKLKVDVGPRFSGAARIGQIQEFGGVAKDSKSKLPPRPFMGPALIKAARSDKLSSFWKDTLRAI